MMATRADTTQDQGSESECITLSVASQRNWANARPWLLVSHDLPLGEAKIRMWNTYFVPSDHPAEHILGWTANVARGAPGGKLETLVISCHGFEVKNRGGYGLNLGSGIRRADTGKFGVLAGLVSKILIFACAVADIAEASGPGSIRDGDGNMLCSEIAKASGAYVTAPQGDVGNYRNESGVAGGLPVGCMPDWEGMVVTYGPRGTVVEAKKY